MKKIKNMEAIKGGACISPAAPVLNNCPGFCMASQIVFANTGSGPGDGGVCIV